MGETKVNLRHLLEDIRDAYPFQIEEAIITELVANALDSGATQIELRSDEQAKSFALVDNGSGMTGDELDRYHDIASSTRHRGKGIGFAGLGAKLALLIADSVTSETKKGRHHAATTWGLAGDGRAPWKVTDPPGLVESESGTAVLILTRGGSSPLLRERFITDVLHTHFGALLEPKISERYKSLYARGICFRLNGQAVTPTGTQVAVAEPFYVSRGKRQKPIGFGVLSKASSALDDRLAGIGICTFGKLIRRGWEWLGITPKNPKLLTGLVEVPALAEIITTSKTDFLRDHRSLQVYYRVRRAVQEAVEPLLKKMDELSTQAQSETPKYAAPLQKEIERILGGMVEEFPEIGALFDGMKLGKPSEAARPQPDGAPIGNEVSPSHGGSTDSPESRTREQKEEKEQEATVVERLQVGGLEPAIVEPTTTHGRKRLPGLMIGFGDDPDRKGELGWLHENTLIINRAHPAYQRSSQSGWADYHILVSASWVLSKYVREDRSPQSFVEQFLGLWSEKRR